MKKKTIILSIAAIGIALCPLYGHADATEPPGTFQAREDHLYPSPDGQRLAVLSRWREGPDISGMRWHIRVVDLASGKIAFDAPIKCFTAAVNHGLWRSDGQAFMTWCTRLKPTHPDYGDTWLISLDFGTAPPQEREALLPNTLGSLSSFFLLDGAPAALVTGVESDAKDLGILWKVYILDWQGAVVQTVDVSAWQAQLAAYRKMSLLDSITSVEKVTPIGSSLNDLKLEVTTGDQAIYLVSGTGPNKYVLMLTPPRVKAGGGGTQPPPPPR